MNYFFRVESRQGGSLNAKCPFSPIPKMHTSGGYFRIEIRVTFKLRLNISCGAAQRIETCGVNEIYQFLANKRAKLAGCWSDIPKYSSI